MQRIQITGTAILSLVLGITAPAFAQREQQSEKQDHPQQQQNRHEQAKPEQKHAQQPRQPTQKQEQAQHVQQQRRPDQNRQTEQRAQQRQRQDQNKRTEQRAQQQQRQDQNKQTQQRAQQQQRQDQNRETQQRAANQQRGNQRVERSPEQRRVEQSAWQQHRSQRWDSDHRNWQQRGGYNGYRIPEDRYRGYFGRDHGFRIYGLPFLVVGGYPRFQYEGYWFSMIDPWPEYWGNNWYDNDDVYVMYIDNGYYLYNHRYPNAGIAINITM